jgi:DNA modification methylase
MAGMILKGDALVRLQERDENSVDSIVTDPPYGLEFMGKHWDAPWKTDRRQTFDGTLNDTRENPYGRSKVRNGNGASYGADARAMQALQDWYYERTLEMWRVLKPGGYLLAFGGSRTYHRICCAIEDAGFEIRDQIMWIYGSGFPKSHNLDGEREGWGTALKPAHEPIVVARKPLEGTVAANVLKWGTGAINIDGCRIGNSKNVPASVSRGKNGSVLCGSVDNSLRCETGLENGHNPNIGRWPANLIHDGSDEVLSAFPSAPGQIADASTNAEQRKTQNVYGAMKRGSQEASRDSDNEGSVGFKMKPGARRLDQGSAARFFYCAKASKSERGPGNTHPTVKPLALMQYLCRLVTPPGGVVLDPFCGSGSTGVAALREGFSFIGIDLDYANEYVTIANNRILAEVLS